MVHIEDKQVFIRVSSSLCLVSKLCGLYSFYIMLLLGFIERSRELLIGEFLS
jgi:hypothetical protein